MSMNVKELDAEVGDEKMLIVGWEATCETRTREP
jgi:hypothetical protein